MEPIEFLNENIFTDLKNVNDGFDTDTILYFTENDFDKALTQIEYYGIGIYEIKTFFEGKEFEIQNHEQYKKKVTDPKWYKKAFLTLKTRQPGLYYSATYKVSKKLLERKNKPENDDSEKTMD